MTNTLIICVGPPGSGKSTWAQAQRQQRKGLKILEADHFRSRVSLRLGLPFFHHRVNEEAFRLWEARLANILRHKRDCVCSDTNLNVFYRQQLIGIAKRRGYRVEAVIFKTSLDALFAANALRTGDRKLDPEVILRYHALLTEQLPLEMNRSWCADNVSFISRT